MHTHAYTHTHTHIHKKARVQTDEGRQNYGKSFNGIYFKFNKSQSDMGILSHFIFTFESPKQILNYLRLFLLYNEDRQRFLV